MRHLWFFRVCASMSFQFGRSVKQFPTIRTRMDVGSVMAILMADQLFFLSETLITMLTLVKHFRLLGVYRFVSLQLRRPVECLATNSARVILVGYVGLLLFGVHRLSAC